MLRATNNKVAEEEEGLSGNHAKSVTVARVLTDLLAVAGHMFIFCITMIHIYRLEMTIIVKLHA